MPYTENKTMANLDPAATVGANDLLLVSQSGVAKRTTVSALEEKILGDKTNLSVTSASDTVIVRSAGAVYEVTLQSLIPALNISAAKIADNAVTGAKLQSSANVDADRAVTTNHIRNGAVDSSKLAPESVSTSAIAPQAVTAEKFAAASVTEGSIARNQVNVYHFGPYTYDAAIGAPSRRLLNPYGSPNEEIDPTSFNAAVQGDTTIPSRRELFSLHFAKVAQANQGEAPWAISVKTCSPSFSGWTQASAVSGHTTLSRGGAYSGGVLLPDGRVFLVPYNAAPAIYDPATDTLEELAWPDGTPPNGIEPNYSLYCGGALLPYDSTNLGKPAFEYPPTTMSADLAVVCAPFYAKKPLLYSLSTGACRYGTTVAGLPNRAFGGISVVHNRNVSGRRCAVLVPHASGSPYLVSNTGDMVIVPGGAIAPGTYGAQLHPTTGDVVFGGGYYYRPITNTWLAGTTYYNFPSFASSGSGSDILDTLSVDGNGIFYQGGTPTAFGHPADAVTNGYKASGIVHTEDGYYMVVPGYWGSGVKPKLLLCSPTTAAFALNIDVGTNILSSGATSSTAAPGNGLFAGGVRLLDGRVFLVPCTSQKAYIISTRTNRITGSPDFHLGPFYNKR